MKKIIYIASFIHLIIVSLAIFHVIDGVGKGRRPLIEKSASFYCSINYSLWHFGFISHDDVRSNELELIIYNINGSVTKYSTLDGFKFFVSNNDLKNRFYGFKITNAADVLIQDLCARSVATRMMNLHAGTTRVSYTIRSIIYPTMEGYSKNEPMKTQTVYTTDFILH